ncbi:metalloendopeptidase [Coemansia nantahalensis]|uniref:Metalloendopeptidase n=1 Tax=Coemansia nantahalensis TaxID=2789366 RepID=A0ACC1K4W2_9FUNG|nr:metalloendopeptidase [Coemansia nantahalensis]
MVVHLQRAAKGAALAFRRTPAEIAAAASALIHREKQAHDEVAAQRSPTFANTIARLARLENDTNAESSVITFLQNVDTDKHVRDASSAAEQALRTSRMASLMREDVYRPVKAVLDDAAALAALDPEDRALAEKMAREYRRNGLGLDADTRKELERIRTRLIAVGIEFSRNINENDGRLLLSRAELDGLPDDYFSGRPTETADGVERFAVTTKYPDLVPAMQLARREDTRRRLQAMTESRCPENIPLLQEAVRLRLAAARLLGYETHAQFVLEDNMARRPEAVLEFQHDLREQLGPLADKELGEMEALKRADKEAAGEPYEGLFQWDARYYANLVKERRHSLSEEEVKQYFPVAQVTRGVLDIYQEMLGLRFVRVDGPAVWHPDVEMYEVWEAAGDAFVGHFYLDLFPRDGKYNHACVCPLRAGCERPDGSREYPAAAMLANFPKPTPAAPALLTHDDVITLLHEFGHVFHHLCARTRWAHFALDSVQMDFVEAPSQLLENWGWEPAVLRRFAVHHKTGEPIPEDLVARLVAAKNEGSGLFNLRQIFFGLYDMALHSTRDPDVDVAARFRELREQITRLSAGSAGAGSGGAATFGHLLGGYDAQYYVYLWAKVFSADMFASRFKRDGLGCAQTGLDYRREVLAPGGSRDAMASMERFLGRRPDHRAFLESIGLAQ